MAPRTTVRSFAPTNRIPRDSRQPIANNRANERPPSMVIRLARIISGGQTGVDRGALDAAIALGIPHGGWCPRGRLAEDGRIPDRYGLSETDSPEYRVRTEQNVIDCDATLILCRGRGHRSAGVVGGGTELTLRLAEQHGRPCVVLDLDQPPEAEDVRRWLEEHQVEVLNVAGPRESQSPGIAERAKQFLESLFAG
jgi:hypothetical protein